MRQGFLAYFSRASTLCCAWLAWASLAVARAIHAARLGLPAPALPPIPTQLLGRRGSLVGM